jgi:hypothetical protein
MRDTAGELDDLGAAGDLALGVGKYLAVLLGDHAGNGVAVAAEQFEKLEQDAGAGQRRGRGPARERRGRGLHRPIDLAGGGKGDAADLLAGRRVEDVAPAPARPLDLLAADIMLDVAHQDAPAR